MPRKKQPIRVAPAAHYGDRQALTAQQQAIPLARSATGMPAPPPDMGMEQQQADRLQLMTSGPPSQQGSSFGPTRRPNEPITAGVNMGPGVGAMPDFRNDPDIALQVMASVFPHPAIYQLMMAGGNW